MFDKTDYAVTIVSGLADILTAVIIYFLVGRRFRKALSGLRRGWVILLITAFLFYTVLYLLSVYPTSIYDRPEDYFVTCMILVMI